MKDDELEALLSLHAAGELDPALAEEVQARVDADPEAAALLASFQALGDLCQGARRAPPAPPARVAQRVLERLHHELDAPASPETQGAADVLTPDQVARLLQVTRDELADEMPSMPFFEFAGRMRIRRERLQEWIDQREQKARRATLMAVGADRKRRR